MSSRLLTQTEQDSIFTTNLKSELDIKFNIFRIYEYKDLSGKHFVILTEHQKNDSDKQSYDSILAFDFKIKDNKYLPFWSLKDFIKVDKEIQECNMNFWTKHLSFKDLNNDGYIEPIISYGFLGLNGFDDGCLKLLIF